MVYVDGYLLIVKRGKLKEYTKMAKEAGKLWLKHGALQYYENVEDDLTSVKQWGGMEYSKALKKKAGEKVMFSFIVYKNKKHRDAVNKKVHAEFSKQPKEEQEKCQKVMDMKRMAFGGFKSLVALDK